MEREERMENEKKEKGLKCKAKGCRRWWSLECRQGDDWQWCEHCDYFGFCFLHAQDDENIHTLQVHEEQCCQ